MTCHCHAFEADGPLTCEDKNLIVQALTLARLKLENYPYPPEMPSLRAERLQAVDAAITKVRALHKPAGVAK